jgi:pimeloyl-ACP methyl ester carboxylesterase
MSINDRLQSSQGGTVVTSPTLAEVVGRRIRAAEPGVFDHVTAKVVLDDGAGDACTIGIVGGRLSVRAGAEQPPTSTIRADHDTLVDVADGRRSGVEAFLHGDLVVSGNLALALQLDGLLEHPAPAGGVPARFTRGGIVRAHGMRTFHLEAGPADGPVVICLHGLGATNASMLPTFYDLAADHRVLAPDLPGFGASRAPRAPYDAAFFARWLDGWMNRLGIESAVIVGNSLGGRIALETALRHPARVRALGLLAPAVAFRRLRQLGPFVRLLRPELAALPLPMSPDPVLTVLRLLFARPERLPESWYSAAAGEFARLYRKRGHRIAFYSALRQIYLDDAFGADGFWTRLPSITAPTLCVWGDHDRLVPAGFARHVSAALPRSQSVTLQDCGHVPQFELPEQTNSAIRSFLRDLGPHALR